MDMVEPIILSTVAGALGGIIRGITGYINAVSKDKNEEWSWYKFLQSVIRGLGVGLVAGAVFNIDWTQALLAGFTGDVVLHDIGLKK